MRAGRVHGTALPAPQLVQLVDPACTPATAPHLVQAGSTAGGAGTAACVDGCLTSLGRELSQTWRRVQLKGALRGGCSAAEWSMCESMLYCRLPCGTCSAAC